MSDMNGREQDRVSGNRARTDIRLAGSGGQGVVLAGVILAEAALLSGQNVAASQAYGPESRGGASRCDVVIGASIGFPVAEALDVLVVLNRDAYQRHAADLRDRGLLLADERRVGRVAAGPWRARSLPIEATAERVAGNPIAANMVALGALAGLTGVVEEEALAQAVRARVPARTQDMNLRALRAGFGVSRAEGS